MLNLLPEVTDSGINESMEASIKDRYNVYIVKFNVGTILVRLVVSCARYCLWCI